MVSAWFGLQNSMAPITINIYILQCECGYEYGANGSDIFERLCPRCQGGAPGIPCSEGNSMDKLFGPNSWSSTSAIDLLQLHVAAINELRRRGILRSKNNPVGDYTEWLVSTRLGLNLETNSNAGYDAVDVDSMRYEIKGRRRTRDNRSVELSAIRNLEKQEFDYLVGVIFRENFSVAYAAVVPYEVVVEKSTYKAHTNGHIFHLRKAILEDSRVRDISFLLK
jgi:hypothetical protein